MISDGADSRVINTTEAAQFMDDDVFRALAADLFDLENPGDIETRGNLANDFSIMQKTESGPQRRIALQARL